MLSPNFEFPVTETEEEKDEYGSPMRVLVYWASQPLKATNKDIKKIVQKRAFIYKDRHEMLASALHEVSYIKCTHQQGQPPLRPSMNNTWILYFSTHFNRGNPPSIPQYRTWRPCAPQRSRSHQWKVLQDSHIKRMKQASNKKVRPCKFQGDLMLKKSLSFNQNPGAKKCLITKDCDKLTRHIEHWCSQEIHCQKKQLAKSKTWKGGKWASRWTENPKGQSRQKLETYKNDENDYPDRLKTHKGDLCKS